MCISDAYLGGSSISNATQLASGYNHAVALRADGTVSVWGDVSYGINQVPRTMTGATQVAAGAYTVVALLPRADCDANGQRDSYEIVRGAAFDCDKDWVPDSCELIAGAPDMNANGWLDACEVALGDIDLDGYVDFGDIALIMLDFGRCSGCPTDLDGSGTVDFGDVAYLLLLFT